MFRNVKNVFLGLPVSAMMISPVFAATGPDFSSLTDSISFDTVVAGVMAIAAGLMGLKLAVSGARKIISFIR